MKAGGPNEDTNKQLADTIKEAKHNSVPKDNIARAIKRAVDGSQGDFKEVVYEVNEILLYVLRTCICFTLDWFCRFVARSGFPGMYLQGMPPRFCCAREDC